MNTGELEAGQGMVLGGEALQESSDSLVARVYTGGGNITSIDQAESHDTAGNCTTHPTGAGNPTAKTSGQAGNQLTVNLQMLGDRQQDAFSSIETGGRE